MKMNKIAFKILCIFHIYIKHYMERRRGKLNKVRITHDLDDEPTEAVTIVLIDSLDGETVKKEKNMSMHFWTVTGYGISEDELRPSVDSQISFIKKYLPEQYKEMQNDCTDSDSCEEWIQDYEDPQGYTGFGALFAMAIQKNEDGFYPEYFCCDGSGAILYNHKPSVSKGENPLHLCDGMSPVHCQ